MFLRPALVAVSIFCLVSFASAARMDADSEQSNVANTVEGQTVPPLSPLSPLSKEERLDALIANSTPPPPLTKPVRVRSGMLSVKLKAEQFGSTLKEIGRQAGFETIVSKEVAEKELTTTFRDIELHKGIQRLLSLISHRNFFIYYGADDSIKKIEVYSDVSNLNTNTTGTSVGSGQGKNRKQTLRTGRSAYQSRRALPGSRNQSRQNISRQGAKRTRPVARSPIVRRIPKNSPDGVERVGPDVPYIVPRQEPQYIPPYKRGR